MNQRWLKLILALYPARWRGRYGSELADLVEELFAEGERSRLEIASNLVLGALSERFSPSPLIPLMVIVALMAAAAGVTRLPAHAHSHRDSGAPLISVQRSKSGRITAITGAPVHVVINPRDGHVVSITRRAR